MEAVGFERPPGRWIGRLAWVAAAVFALVLLAPVATVIVWFNWHPAEHYGVTVASTSADGRTLTLDVDGFLGGSPTPHVHESGRVVRIDVTSPMHRAILGQCGGQKLRVLVVRLREPLGTRALQTSRRSCG